MSLIRLDSVTEGKRSMPVIGASVDTIGHFTIHEALELDDSGEYAVIGYLIVGPTVFKSEVFDTLVAAIEKAVKLLNFYYSRLPHAPDALKANPA
jgi:hypothetical protein